MFLPYKASLNKVSLSGLQSGFRPACAFCYGFVLVGCQFFEVGKEFGVSAVAHGDGGIAAKAGSSGAADWGSAEGLAEFFPRNFRKPG